MTNSNHIFSAFSFISFILISIPLPWHFRAGNTPTCLHIFWVSLSNLTFFIDSVLWDGNIVDRSPVWCDISSRLIFANYVAIPATCLCIQRRIYHVTSDLITTNVTAVKRRKFTYDLLIGVGVPLLSLVFAYIVQQNRYVIVEDYGCCVKFYKAAVSVVLIASLRLALCLISGTYGCLNMYHIWTKRQEFKSTLSESSALGGPNYDHYMRLFMLSGIDILLTIPFNLWYFTTWFPIMPWPGWEAVHTHWNEIPLITVAELRNTGSISATEIPRCMNVVYGFIFFLFFGASAEARNRYMSAWQYVSRLFCWQTGSSGKSSRSLHINFAEQQNSDSNKFDFSEPSFVSRRSVIASSIASDADFKPAESFVLSGDLAQVSQQYYIMPIPHSPTSSDLESRDGVH